LYIQVKTGHWIRTGSWTLVRARFSWLQAPCGGSRLPAPLAGAAGVAGAGELSVAATNCQLPTAVPTWRAVVWRRRQARTTATAMLLLALPPLLLIVVLAAETAAAPLRLSELVSPEAAVFPGNNVSVNYLKGALPLPKIHYSWAFPPAQFEQLAAVDSLLVDYARVAGAVPLGSHADWGSASGCGAPKSPPCANRQARTRMAVQACHQASLVKPPLGRPADSPPQINLNFSPWYGPFAGGRNASSTEGEVRETPCFRALF
jgi:hypothetical protein